LSLCFSGLAQSKDNKDNSDGDDDAAKMASTLPNIYLDLRAIYTAIPANSLATGFSHGSISSIISTQQRFSLTNQPAIPTSPALSTPASRSFGVDIPLTVDINDRFSVYGGFSAATTQSGTADWTTFAVASWNVGFQADLYQQNGGLFLPWGTRELTHCRLRNARGDGCLPSFDRPGQLNDRRGFRKHTGSSRKQVYEFSWVFLIAKHWSDIGISL
jgi:hypothetical protein